MMQKFKNLNINLKSGQFLIESIVAIGIVTVGLVSLLGLLSNSLSLNRVVADQYTATYLASEGIEVVKAIVDKNIIQSQSCGGCIPWNTGIANGNFEIQYDDNALEPDSDRYIRVKDGVYSYDLLGSATPFKRKIIVQLVGADEIQVNSRVNWITRGNGSFTVNLEDHFYNWR